MKKRIAVCITYYEPGGQSVVVEETTKRFAKFYDVDLYCVGASKPKPAWIDNLYLVKPWVHKYIPIVNKQFINDIKSRNYALIHCHDSLPFLNAFYKNGIKYMVTCLGNTDWQYRDGLVSKIDGIASLLFYGRGYKEAVKVISISKYLQEWLKKTYKVESQVIDLGANTDRFHPTQKANWRDKRFIYFGQISYRKGILDLIQMSRLIKDKHPDFVLEIYGFGKEEFMEKVRNLIKKHKLEKNVNLIGFIKDEEQNSKYNSALGVISASYWEGFGLPIIEAYRCNRPIFVRNRTAMKDLVVDERFRFDDVDQLVGKLDYFLSNEKEFRDIDWTTKLDSEKFSWDFNSKRYLDIIEEIIANTMVIE